MAMSPRPDLIVFDEPTTALDVTTQVEVLAAMREVVKTFNTAAIYITHDLSVVAQMADTIKVLRFGAEIEEAETRKMLSSPKDDYTKTLWSVRSLIKPEETSEDIILSIDNISTKGMSIEDAVKLIRGQRGTTVKLEIFRDGNSFYKSLSREK